MSNTKVRLFLFLLVLLAIPVTVLIAQQRQDIRQLAQNPPPTAAPAPTPTPTPTPHSPRDGAVSVTGGTQFIVGQPKEIAGTIHDPDGNLARIELLVAPYTGSTETSQSFSPLGTSSACSGEVCTVTRTWTPDRAGVFTIIVRGYDATGLQCSGNPFVTYPNNNFVYCGQGSNKEVTSQSVANPGGHPPTGTINNPPTTVTVNQSVTFNATLHDADSDLNIIEILVAPYQGTGGANRNYQRIGMSACSGGSCSLPSDAWTPPQPGQYTVIVQGYDATQKKCSGDPYQDYTQNVDGWVFCGEGSWARFTVPPPPSPTPTSPPPPSATPTRAPTPTPLATGIPPGNTALAVSVNFEGFAGTAAPLRTTEPVEVSLVSPNFILRRKPGLVTYSPTTHHFDGVVDLGNTIPTGTYQLFVKGTSYLRRNVEDVTIQSQTLNRAPYNPDKPLLACDLNNDNRVDIFDIQQVEEDLRIGFIRDSFSDITREGAIDIFDRNYCVQNFLKESEEDVFAPPITPTVRVTPTIPPGCPTPPACSGNLIIGDPIPPSQCPRYFCSANCSQFNGNQTQCQANGCAFTSCIGSGTCHDPSIQYDCPITPSPTQSVACQPRPNVTIQPVLVDPGHMRVTITTNTNAGTSDNGVQHVHFDSATNVQVTVGDAVIAVPSQYSPPPPANTVNVRPSLSQFIFDLHQITAGQAGTVNFRVHDTCGEWSSFAGAGAAGWGN